MRMTYIGTRATVALATLVMAAACGDRKASDESLAAQAASDAASRDLAMASADTNAKPRLQDVPIVDPKTTSTKAPAKNTPTPTKPSTTPPMTKPTAAAIPVTTPSKGAATIAAGTTLKFASSGKVCSNVNKTGETFTAALSSDAVGSNGALIPAGSVATFEITNARTAKNSGDSTFLRMRIVSVQVGSANYNVDASIDNVATERARSATTGDDAKKVAGGAVVGAIIGKIVGKSTKGAVIGGAAGAAGGAAVASATADYDTCLKEGAAIVVKLDTPLSLKSK